LDNYHPEGLTGKAGEEQYCQKIKNILKKWRLLPRNTSVNALRHRTKKKRVINWTKKNERARLPRTTQMARGIPSPSPRGTALGRGENVYVSKGQPIGGEGETRPRPVREESKKIGPLYYKTRESSSK